MILTMKKSRNTNGLEVVINNELNNDNNNEINNSKKDNIKKEFKKDIICPSENIPIKSIGIKDIPIENGGQKENKKNIKNIYSDFSKKCL